MHIKTHPAMTVLYVSVRTTLNRLHEHIGCVARDLYAEAARQHLLVAGPQYWLYYGMDGNPDTVFTLQIALPISGIAETGNGFLSKILPSLKCVSVIHQDDWDKMSATYERLLQYIKTTGQAMNGEFREVYLNIDFTNTENNMIEIQAGIM